MPASALQSQPDASPADSLSTALLLAATGGLTDVIVYIDHGHVFANAMTGNVVLLGISALSHDWMQTLHHIAPLVGYIAGVTVSKLIRSLLGSAAGIAGLSVEILTLFLTGWLPRSFPELVFTTLIAFVSALQVSSFRHVGPFSYNSTFITGNLRDTSEGLYDRLVSGDPAGFVKFRDLGSICLCFLAGAIVGALTARTLGNFSFWIAEPLLLFVLFRLLFASRTNQSTA